MALLTVKNLKLGYDQQIVISDLSFEVNKGDYLCIIGENGSGKSTLMKTLLGLTKPLGGDILTGEALSKNEIGYLPQQSFIQRDFPASVWEIVLSGCQGRLGKIPFYSKADKALARKNMEKMGISSFSKRCYRELSGGQQQRVLLARALCAAKEILLLDEPVAGLDPKVTSEMYSLIKSLNQNGITIIMISHDISASVKYASHILHIGDEIFFGSKNEYLKSSLGKKFVNQHEIQEPQGGSING